MTNMPEFEGNEETVSSENLRESILDTIQGSQQLQQLQDFDAMQILESMFEQLDERSRHILRRRYGLTGLEPATLEAIGQELDLTRERIRQIEKESIRKLSEQKKHPKLVVAHQLLTNLMSDHGNVMHEDELVRTLLMSGQTNRHEAGVKFLLELEESFEQLRHDDYHPAWYLRGFNLSLLHDLVKEYEEILRQQAKPMKHEELVNKVKQREHYQQNQHFYNEKALFNYLIVTKKVQENPFGEIGLTEWSAISPRDVGDKAYIVMKHHGEPEHYSRITELINKAGFDDKTAYKETVHNELIKDKRFVLVGRGIYALREWGYKPGVVADIIVDVLKKAGGPLERDKIVEEVLKQRLVKRNTILVGLSNKDRFVKVDKDKYALAEQLENQQ